MEAWTTAGVQTWDGLATLTVTARDAAGAVLARDRARVRVAPWIGLPNSARTRTLHVATGKYPNEAMLGQLGQLLPSLGAQLVTYRTDRWQEMWMQDTMELGHTEIPGARLHVVLLGLRGADAFGPTLLGPGVGVLQVGRPRSLASEDQWSDWFGNLEFTHPTPRHPLGRACYGKNVRTGATLHPDVVRFLVAQEVQDPFWIDTSWLAIKHVDEVFNVLPGPDGRGVIVLASAREGARAAPSQDDAYNRGLQVKLDAIVRGAGSTPGLLGQLGLDAARVIELPVLYHPERLAGWTAPGAHNAWSNPVNAVYVNGAVLAGGTDMTPAVRDAVRRAFARAGVSTVHFLDDACYQQFWGNVHCATNTLREPPVASWWRAPASTP